MELRGLEYESRGRNTEDTKRGGNNLNKEISVTRKVRTWRIRLRELLISGEGFGLLKNTHDSIGISCLTFVEERDETHTYCFKPVRIHVIYGRSRC